MPQAGHAALPTTAHPLTDRTFRHTQGRGDVALPPALLFQFPGTQPPPLAPVRADRSGLRHVRSPAFCAPALDLCPESFSRPIGATTRARALLRSMATAPHQREVCTSTRPSTARGPNSRNSWYVEPR